MTKQELINIAISYVINIEDQAGNKLDVIEFNDVEKIIDELILKQDQAKREAIENFANWHNKTHAMKININPLIRVTKADVEGYIRSISKTTEQ